MKRLLNTIKEKWPEYVIEGIVIVGSIIVAIQLENWNDNRKESKEERRYLERLLLDMRKDSVVISSEVADLQNQLILIDTFLFTLARHKEVSSSQIKIWVEGVMGINVASRANATFQDLVNSGQTKLLSDKQLVELLYDYYNQVEDTKTKAEESSIAYGRQTLNPYLMKVGPVFTEISQFQERSISMSDLAKDDFFLSILGFKRILITNQRLRYLDQQATLNHIIDKISKSLSK